VRTLDMMNGAKLFVITSLFCAATCANDRLL
jgi:hypothetical protein